MEEHKAQAHQNTDPTENKLFCEKYREWVEEEDGCQHRTDYCSFRRQCLIYLKEKFKDL